MGVPCSPFVGFDVDLDFRSRGSYQSDVKVELTEDLRLCGQFVVDAGCSKEVECEEGLWEKMHPDVEREVFVCGC